MKISTDFHILKTPEKCLSDKKDYKLLRLANGLKVLLVKQESNQSSQIKTKLKQKLGAVALCIGSGCFQDLPDVPGLSHFLEHMIFMGSEKYPKENEFDQFVTAHGGFDNAYTECEHTLFHFDIIEKHLAGALDRFSQLFIAPLMSVDSMEREMKAVESEFQSNSMDDEVRVSQIYCTMIDESHPASNFIWGNLKTLRDEIAQKELHCKLHDFCRRNYVASQMFLCIQSSVDMSRLERTVVKCFADIPRGVANHQTPIALNHFDIFKRSFHDNIFFVKSTSEKCKLLMTFLLPLVKSEMKFLEYLASLIQFEGAGSLCDYFKDELLALKVKAKVGSQSFEGNSMFTFFTIEVNLTSKGFEDFDSVLKAIFAFLLLIKTTPIEEHKKRFNEFKEIKDVLFKYRKEKSPIENVQELAVNMKYFEENVLIGKEICPEFHAQIMQNLIATINERKFNLLIMSDKHQKYNKVEKWFGTEYAEVEFPITYKRLWNERWLCGQFFLQKSNEFICKDFDIFCDSSEDPFSDEEIDFKGPEKIFENSNCECFYKLDKKFKLPHGFVYIFFASPTTESSVFNLNMTSIYSMCVKNFISDQVYPATTVGYNYKLNSVDNGLILRLSGFNEKLPLIVDIITKAVRGLNELVDKNVFETFRRELKKNFHNCLVDESLLNDDCRLSVLKKHHRSFFDRLDNVELLKFPDFKMFCEVVTESLKVKVLIQGNINESQALHINQIISDNMKLKDEKVEMHNLSEIYKIPLGSSYLKIKSLRNNDGNSIMKNYYQIGKATMQNECLAEFLVSILYEPLFDTLRSHEQLGYEIACMLRKNCGILGITITVDYQENKNSADIIDTKIDEFLSSFYETLKAMNDKEFKSVKHSMVSVKLIADADLEKEVNRNWEEIRNGKNVFDRLELEALEIEKLTKDEAVEFYHQTFLAPSHSRKLSVQVIGDENFYGNKSARKNNEAEKEFRDGFKNELNSFKENLEVFE